MTMIASYHTIAAPAEGEFTDKGSRFFAYALPVCDTDEVKIHLARLREQHPKARHYCYAYRMGADGAQWRMNDDGEPSGSAGRPIFGQIQSLVLSDVLVVVVRYFGGTLLGVPGLIHAYKTAARLALDNAQIIEKQVEKTVYLRCAYAHLSEALRLAKQHHGDVIAQDLQLDCRLTVRIPLAHYAACVAAWQETRVMEIADNPFQAE